MLKIHENKHLKLNKYPEKIEMWMQTIQIRKVVWIYITTINNMHLYKACGNSRSTKGKSPFWVRHVESPTDYKWQFSLFRQYPWIKYHIYDNEGKFPTIGMVFCWPGNSSPRENVHLNTSSHFQNNIFQMYMTDSCQLSSVSVKWRTKLTI